MDLMRPGGEQPEQERLADWLDRRHLVWTHVPLGGSRTRNSGRTMKKSGAKRGVPDVLVFSAPPMRPSARGVAIELKRLKGGVVSKFQEHFKGQLEACGWLVCVCRGADEAIAWLKGLGY